jgi:D-xylose transport system ATP-binding protein
VILVSHSIRKRSNGAGTFGCRRRSSLAPLGRSVLNQGETKSGAANNMTDDRGAAMKPIFEATGVNKSFGSVHVLHDVDFTVYAGKVTALIGDNGAGKSTLIKCLAGIYTAETGEYRFDGSSVTLSGPRSAFDLGIKVVYQDLALCENLDIVQNMFLGRELTVNGLLDERSMEQAARETLASLSVRTVKSVRQSVSSLSGGQRQTVAIAKAVLGNSKVVILDEPTAALGVAQTEQVLALVRRLADSGVGVVLISHNMNEVLQVADRVCAMYLGRIADDIAIDSSIRRETLVELITSGSSGQYGDQRVAAVGEI